jgi:hypothetical protein
VAEVDPDDNEEAKVGTNDDRVKIIEGLGGLRVEVSVSDFTSRRRRSLPPGRNR